MNEYAWDARAISLGVQDGDKVLSDFLNRAQHEVFSVVPLEHGKVLIVQRASKRTRKGDEKIQWYARPKEVAK